MKTRKIVRLGERIPDRAVLIQRFGRAKRQRECYEFLEAKGGSCRLTDLGAPGGFARSVISGLVDKGLAVIEDDATDTVIKDSRPASSMAKDKRNSRVLVVEDEDATSFLILNALSSFTEVKLAATVAEAWQFLKTESIDALILDLILPDGDGRQILTQLRSCPETVYLPVTILSAKGSRATKLECFRLGADDFFEKPVDPPVLGAAVRVSSNVRARSLPKVHSIAQRGSSTVQRSPSTLRRPSPLPSSGTTPSHSPMSSWMHSRRSGRNRVKPVWTAFFRDWLTRWNGARRRPTLWGFGRLVNS